MTTLNEMKDPYKAIFEKETRGLPTQDRKNFLGRIRRFAKSIGIEGMMFYEEHKEGCRSNLGEESR